jgi:hypothetical protein
VYFNKHIDSLMTFVRTGRLESEGLRGRLDDIRNYIDILEAMLVEEGSLPHPDTIDAPKVRKRITRYTRVDGPQPDDAGYTEAHRGPLT